MPDRQPPAWAAVPPLPRWIACVGGAGLLHPGPGTWGSVVGAIAAWGTIRCVPGDATVASMAMICGTAATTVIGTWAAGAWQRHTGIEDPSQVVIDEVAGVWLALACVPGTLLIASPGLATIVVLLMFRLFDITKPWPVSACERLPGGFGVMADDLAAGLFAGLVGAAALR